jgi:MoxR-like ATPase
LRATQVRAASQGRGFVAPEDVKSLALPVLAHRLVLSPDAEVRGLSTTDVVEGVLAAVASPRRLVGV